jgi:hypothetical protein
MSKTYRIHHADGSPENLVDKIGARVVIEKDDKGRLTKIKHGKRVIKDAISIRELNPRVESLEPPPAPEGEA